jgi:nucleoside-diphosphate-sugar epimerase
VILVTGASGFIGRHLVRALVRADVDQVRALVRGEAAADAVRQAAEESGGGVEVAFSDLADAGSLAAAADGCGLVYHLAGSYRGSPADLHSSHVAGTARLLRAVDPAARVVLVSSTSVYGWHQQYPADESSPPRPESAYGSAKLAAERLVLARTTGSAVVVRPTITYGLDDTHGMLPRAYALLRRGVRRLPGTGRNRIHLTHVDDLVAGLLLVGTAGDGVYVMAGPEATPVRRIMELLAQGAGLAPPSFGIPAGAARLAASGVSRLWPVLGRRGESPLTVHSVDVVTRDRAYSSARAERELGWKALVDAEDGIPAVGAWLANGEATGRGAAKAAGAKAAGAKAGAAEAAVPGPARKPSAVSVVSGNESMGDENELGFEWRTYIEDDDEGLGTVYERFALRDILRSAVARTGSQSVLHAPLFGMMGFPGIDTVFMAQDGLRVGLLDFCEERLDAVVTAWEQLGLHPEPHLVDGPDPAGWPEELSASYDLVYSFAALWWFDDPWAVLAAQSRWADRAVLSCVPNRNLFIRVRARYWHKDLFTRLNLEALDADAQAAAARALGLEPVESELFDLPPFPDTSVPLAKVLRAIRRKEADTEGAWRWSMLSYFRGEDPTMEERVAGYQWSERVIPARLAPYWAHHRQTLFVPRGG